MKTINSILIFCSEIKIGAGGCELFVVHLEGDGVDISLDLSQKERGREKVFNQLKAALIM